MLVMTGDHVHPRTKHALGEFNIGDFLCLGALTLFPLFPAGRQVDA